MLIFLNLFSPCPEHEDGDGREDDSFHVPNFSFSTSAVSQSPPSQDPFSVHTPFSSNPSDFPHQQDVPVSLYTKFMDDISATRDGKVEGLSSQSQDGVSSTAPSTSLTLDRLPYKMTASFNKNPSSHQISNQDYQHPVGDPKPITLTGDQWKRSNVKPNPTAANPFPGQDLISSGLQMLKMTPPSSHSSPMKGETPRGLEGVTLGDILRVTGGWDGLREGRRGMEEEFRDFREIQPTLDDTKTTSK